MEVLRFSGIIYEFYGHVVRFRLVDEFVSNRPITIQDSIGYEIHMFAQFLSGAGNEGKHQQSTKAGHVYI